MLKKSQRENMKEREPLGRPRHKWILESTMGGCGQVTGSCEHSSERLGSIELPWPLDDLPSWSEAGSVVCSWNVWAPWTRKANSLQLLEHNGRSRDRWQRLLGLKKARAPVGEGGVLVSSRSAPARPIPLASSKMQPALHEPTTGSSSRLM